MWEVERIVPNVPIVGMAYTGIQPALGSRVLCLPCPLNVYDATAVGVYLETGVRFGYLTKIYAPDIVRYFAQPFPRLVVIQISGYSGPRSACGELRIFRYSTAWPKEPLSRNIVRLVPCVHEVSLKDIHMEPLVCSTCFTPIKSIQLGFVPQRKEEEALLLAPPIINPEEPVEE